MHPPPSDHAPASRDPNAQQRRPDFFIVGHFKCGTTALYEMLQQHPDVFMPAMVKEPGFFGKDLRRTSATGASTRGDATSLDEYLALFAAAGPTQIAGEATPYYLTSSTAASEIAAFNPDARIIAIFREPASFLHSAHLQLLQVREENVPHLRDAMMLESARRAGHRLPRHTTRPPILYYSDHVRYTDQLRRYHDVFPSDQILVLLYEDFQADNDQTIRKILRFLDLDDSAAIEATRANPSVRVRSQLLRTAVHRVSVGSDPVSRIVKAAIKVISPTSARRRILHDVETQVLHASAAPPDPAFAAELRSRLIPEVDRFGTYLGRDLLRRWGYTA